MTMECEEIGTYSSYPEHFNEDRKRLINDLSRHATEQVMATIGRVASATDDPEVASNVVLSAAISVFVSTLHHAKEVSPDKAPAMIAAVMKMVNDALQR